jgi:hypothetical protein
MSFATGVSGQGLGLSHIGNRRECVGYDEVGIIEELPINANFRAISPTLAGDFTKLHSDQPD